MKPNSKKWLFSILAVICLCTFGGVVAKLAYDFNTDMNQQSWYKDTAPKITYDENDDNTDNRFYEPLGRFPEIEEDEPPYRLLCTEYPAAKD